MIEIQPDVSKQQCSVLGGDEKEHTKQKPLKNFTLIVLTNEILLVLS